MISTSKIIKNKNEIFEISNYNGLDYPYNIEAEQSVIGAILIDKNCLNIVIEVLPKAHYFYLESHQKIYSAILEMFNLSLQIDYVTVLNKLKSMDEKDNDEFKQYLFDLTQLVPSISNIESYAKIVRDKYNLRKLMIAIKETLKDIYEKNADSSEAVNLFESKLSNIKHGKDINKSEKISELLLEQFERIDKLNSSEAYKYKEIQTGFKDLDDKLKGLARSNLIFLAARPGMGKTSFALNIASNVVLNENSTVVFFSLEMSKEQLTSRIISSYSQIDYEKIRAGNLSETEWGKFMEATNKFVNANLYICDLPGMSILEMKSRLRKLDSVGLVIIDYLQLLSGTKRVENRVQEISDITRNLKIMAKEFNVPILTLSQLSRASEQRTDHRPLLSDLRDSGSIEQDADVVLFLYREGYYSSEKDNSIYNYDDIHKSECIIAKNRHGATGKVMLTWEGRYMLFNSKKIDYPTSTTSDVSDDDLLF